jgi:hypothetical protein
MTLINGSKESSNDAPLPSSKSRDLSLTHPTAEERLKQLRLNGAAWRGALSLDGYLRREHHLSQQDATRDGGLTRWVLVDSSNAKERRVLAGCETYRKNAIVAHRGEVKETVAHGVGSVFCAEEFRGRGYGGRMMQDLGEALTSWQYEHCLFSVLFSDIGKV